AIQSLAHLNTYKNMALGVKDAAVGAVDYGNKAIHGELSLEQIAEGAASAAGLLGGLPGVAAYGTFKLGQAAYHKIEDTQNTKADTVSVGAQTKIMQKALDRVKYWKNTGHFTTQDIFRGLKVENGNWNKLAYMEEAGILEHRKPEQLQVLFEEAH